MAQFEEVGVEAVVRGFTQYMLRMQQMGRATYQFGNTASRISGGAGIAATAITGIGLAAVAAAAVVTTAAVAIGAGGVKIGASFESAFAGVLKTTEGLGNNLFSLTEQGKQIFQEFRDLAKEIPLSFEELASIGELAGQLGIPEAAIVSFSETIARLGVTTNLTTQDAATEIAKLQNIYAVAAENMGASTQDVGNVLVELGNNFATTEADILAFGQRIASAGKIAGLSQADVLAIGAALSSVGVEAEAGGTAVQKMLISIQQAVATGSKELTVIGETAGWTAQEFADAWQVDAAGAFNEFIIGLGQAGDDAFAILDEIGVGNARSIRSFLALANAEGLLTKTLDSANSEWTNGNALIVESEKRFATFQSQVDIMKNRFKDMGATIGIALIPKLLELFDAASPFIEEFAANLPGIIDNVLATFNKIGDGVGGVIEKIKSVFEAFKSGGFSGAFEEMGMSAGFAEGFGSILTTIGDIVKKIADAIGTLVTTILPKITDWFEANRPVLEQAIQNIASVIEFLGGIIAGFIDIAVPLIATLVDAFLSGISFIASLIAGDWSNAWNSFKDIISTIFTGIFELVHNFWIFIFDIFGVNYDEWIAKTIDWGINFFDNIKQAFNNVITSISGWFASIISSIVGFVDQTILKFNSLKEKIIVIIEGIKSDFRALISSLTGIGGSMIQGLFDGIKAKWEGIKSKVTEFVNGVVSFIKEKLKIDSPSKVFMEIGRNVSLGLAQGIIDGDSVVRGALNQLTNKMVSGNPVIAGASGNTTSNKTVNNTINANYERVQSPSSIANDLILVEMITR